MKKIPFPLILLGLLTTAQLTIPPQAQPPQPPRYAFAFQDVTASVGLSEPLAGIRGHAAAWGDVDGDGWPDLFVGTFHTAGKPGQLFLNRKGKFSLDSQEVLRVSACASGAVFADLTNAGRLDLFVSNNANGKDAVRSRASQLFRNLGAGKFEDASADSGTCPPGFLGRTTTAADVDGDGLLDLLAAEFYYTPQATRGLALYRNGGKHRFTDETKKRGLPTGQACPTVAVADVNGDGWPDVFVTAADGNNRLFLNDGTGNFREAPGTRQVFAWRGLSKEDPLAGVCIADVNGDGLPDIIVGHHFKQPWRRAVAIRLYLNRGIQNGELVFEDVTERVGLTALGMKAPHVEVQDFDNDGLPDIFTGIVKFNDGKAYPVIYRNEGTRDGLPKFVEMGWNVNDFPAKADREAKRTTDFYARMLKEKKVVYAAAAPCVDFDQDGRMDVFMATWWEETTPLLLRNETKGNHWLQVTVEGKGKVNRQGVGSLVRVWAAGKVGKAGNLLGSQEISLSQGWCSGREAMVHFGLGKTELVDVEVVLPHKRGTIVTPGVRADQRLRVAMKTD